MSTVYNHSAQSVEPAERTTCPRCKGRGSKFGDATRSIECICKGEGEVWRSESGWCRAIGSRQADSTHY